VPGPWKGILAADVKQVKMDSQVRQETSTQKTFEDTVVQGKSHWR
jgi:hypothetical protein